MKKIIALFLVIILLFNIFGCSTIKIKNEYQITEKQKYVERKATILFIETLFVFGSTILGEYIGYNIYPGNESGSEIIKVPAAVIGTGIGFAAGSGIIILTNKFFEKVGILKKEFNDKGKDK
jgi:zinc transporter ZupT